ncbi:hypothetical protein D8I35_04455 [Corticibacter populi]|uniref:DUF3352 domain-containing protein n=1 Tax=Corticibacter populi TaxID=1550736 RepID=A0A3M6QZ97_9BURK|nr:hypothetical protein [Corticibacter populi]RMX08354.1 hypothetical protein D8I35_04455 [Corticibacter populi]RZS35647.1 hypothetical protein EV687_0719 [Corticibacter populi]
MKKTAVFAALALALGACSKKEDAAQVKADIPLAFAPADTAFVFGNLEPAPSDYVKLQERMLDTFKTGLIQSIQRASETGAELIDDAQEQQRLQSVLNLLQEKLGEKDGLQSIGVSLSGHAAGYEVLSLPVLRIELADVDKFKAFIADIETRAGQKLPTAEVDGQAYWFVASPAGSGRSSETTEPAEAAAAGATAESSTPAAGSSAAKPRLRGVAAIVGKHLVMTLDPQRADVPLATLLGLNKPAQSVLDAGTLQAINKQYGFKPYGGTVLIDTQRLLARFIGTEGQETWISKEAAAQGLDTTSVICRTELQAIASKAPRLVAGATELSDNKMHVAGALELEGGLAKSLTALTSPVPGLGKDHGNLEFGLGIKLDQLASFLQGQAAAIQAAPYQCESLQALNEGAGELQQNLAGLYAVAGWVSGFRANLSEFDPSSQKVTGTLLVASPNPVGLIGMVQGFVPEIAQLGLTPNGQAKELNSPMAAMATNSEEPIWVAMGEAAVGIGLGANAKDQLEKDLKASAASPAPFLYYAIDGQTYVKLLSSFDEDDFVGSASSEAEETANYIAWPLINSAAEFYKNTDFVDISYVFTERGVEFTQQLKMK